MQIEKPDLIQKTATLLEFNRILDRLAYHSMSEEAGAMIRAEQPLDDPAAVAKTKTAVRAITSRVNSEGGDPRRYLLSIGFLLPKLEVEGMSLEIDEACAIG